MQTDLQQECMNSRLFVNTHNTPSNEASNSTTTGHEYYTPVHTQGGKIY